jgi:hypothetical protein
MHRRVGRRLAASTIRDFAIDAPDGIAFIVINTSIHVAGASPRAARHVLRAGGEGDGPRAIPTTPIGPPDKAPDPAARFTSRRPTSRAAAACRSTTSSARSARTSMKGRSASSCPGAEPTER